MMYPYMTLNDDTEITHSEMKPDGRVKVYIETPVENGFHNATCYLPDYIWEDITGYSEAEEERKEAAREELERRQREYAALEAALTALDAAHTGLQARFSPALNRLAGDYLAKLTGGKYDKVSLTRQFEALAEEAGSLQPRRALALSQGTADQLYLAVRLAACRLVLPGEEPCPLVLDDALANFDDERMALALDCLSELGKERQILLFTCHSREKAWEQER